MSISLDALESFLKSKLLEYYKLINDKSENSLMKTHKKKEIRLFIKEYVQKSTGEEINAYASSGNEQFDAIIFTKAFCKRLIDTFSDFTEKSGVDFVCVAFIYVLFHEFGHIYLGHTEKNKKKNMSHIMENVSIQSFKPTRNLKQSQAIEMIADDVGICRAVEFIKGISGYNEHDVKECLFISLLGYSYMIRSLEGNSTLKGLESHPPSLIRFVACLDTASRHMRHTFNICFSKEELQKMYNLYLPLFQKKFQSSFCYEEFNFYNISISSYIEELTNIWKFDLLPQYKGFNRMPFPFTE